MEPLNRYETDLVKTLSDGVQLIEAVGAENVKLLADLFHMNIEETDPAQAILDCPGKIGHMHFVDSNRRAAGFGHMDYGPIAHALSAIGYNGFASAEAFPLPDAKAAAEMTIKAYRRYFGWLVLSRNQQRVEPQRVPPASLRNRSLHPSHKASSSWTTPGCRAARSPLLRAIVRQIVKRPLARSGILFRGNGRPSVVARTHRMQDLPVAPPQRAVALVIEPQSLVQCITVTLEHRCQAGTLQWRAAAVGSDLDSGQVQ